MTGLRRLVIVIAGGALLAAALWPIAGLAAFIVAWPLRLDDDLFYALSDTDAPVALVALASWPVGSWLVWLRLKRESAEP